MGQIPVSVIIPCYNHGQYIRAAIASVEQCEPDLYEIIIVNDGSTDPNTLEVMRGLETDGYHVINQRNQGLGSARNIGIGASRGKYILPLDADNRIRPNYIYKSVKILDANSKISVVYGKPYYFGDHSEISFSEVCEFDILRLLDGNFIDACAVFRKSVWEEFGGYDTQMPDQGLEDWDFWLSLAFNGHRFYFLDEIVFDYNIRNDSMMRTLNRGPNYTLVLEYLFKKHPMLGLFYQNKQMKRRLRELESFVEDVRRNPFFKLYHGIKYLGRE